MADFGYLSVRDYGVKLASRSGDILDSIKEDLNYASEYDPFGVLLMTTFRQEITLYGIENLPQNIICINPAKQSYSRSHS